MKLLTESEFLKLCISALGSMGAQRKVSIKVNETWERYKEGSSDIYHAKPHILYAASWVMNIVRKSDPSKQVFIPSLLTALLYHDAIFVVGAKDNEELCAELSVRDLTDMGVQDNHIKLVSMDIMQTKHAACPDYNEGRVMVDADIASLSTPNIEAFWADTNRLWKESGKDAETFARGNSAFLKSLADRGVYCSVPMYVTYIDEARAQQNIAVITKRLDEGLLGVTPVLVA